MLASVLLWILLQKTHLPSDYLQDVQTALSMHAEPRLRDAAVARVSASVNVANDAQIRQSVPVITAVLSSTSAALQQRRYATLMLYGVAHRKGGPNLIGDSIGALSADLAISDLPLLRTAVLTLQEFSKVEPQRALPLLVKSLNRPPAQELVGSDILAALLYVAPDDTTVQQAARRFLAEPGNLNRMRVSPCRFFRTHTFVLVCTTRNSSGTCSTRLLTCVLMPSRY